MSRGLIVLTVFLFVLMVVCIVIGFSQSAPGLLVLGMFIAGPGFMFCLGLAIGRASNEYALIRRSDSNVVVRSGSSRGRVRQQYSEPESLS